MKVHAEETAVVGTWTPGDGTRRLRVCRAASLVLLVGCSFAVFVAVCAVSRLKTFDEFDGDVDLDVTVYGCDVNVRKAARNGVVLSRWTWQLGATAVQRRYGGSGKLRELVVRNTQGCHNAPFFDCKHSCKVAILVANAPPLLRVAQGAGDTTDHLTARVTGCTLRDFRLTGGFDVALERAVVTGSLYVKTTTGSVRIRVQPL